VIQPQVLLFDEPLSNLDAKLRVYMRGEIRRLQKALSITAVYVTHDQEEAMAISDHIAVMNEGKIVQIGTAEELYLRPESPFVAQFIGKINLLQAVVKEVRETEASLEILGQIYEIPNRIATLALGRRVNIFIRPESVGLVKEIGEKELKGVIVEKTFLGEKVDYVLDIDGQRLNATSYDPFQHGTFSLAQEIGVRFNPDSIAILKEEEK
jgi:iron(III) transport system ATP-binding protein